MPQQTHASAADIARIRALAGRATYEATRPTGADMARVAPLLPRGQKLYISAVSHTTREEALGYARVVHAAGFDPVPHVAARRFSSRAELDETLAELTAEIGVREIMLIGGDLDRPAGPFACALDVIESGALERRGVRAIGVAAHPQGHPRIGEDALESALVTKLAAAQRAGIEAHIVTQFGFDTAPTLKWLAWLRQRGVHAPVRIGLAGPTSLSTWLAFARRCGVRASGAALARRAGLARNAFHAVAPDVMLEQLAAGLPAGESEVAPHFFSFGGLPATVRWARAVEAGAFNPSPDGGFDARVA